jgi:uncharacterized protein YndB with AHSA1/START domain
MSTATAMNTATEESFGKLVAPRTIEIQRLLPGPIERIWDYLTKSDLRRQWLASGDMELKVGAACELVWHHDETTKPPGARPDGVNPESHLPSRITVCEPPHKLGFMFWSDSEVLFELKPAGNRVLLTLTHKNLPSRGMMVGVSTGWHTHLDVLAARVSDTKIENFWDHWRGYKAEYEKRIPADM